MKEVYSVSCCGAPALRFTRLFYSTSIHMSAANTVSWQPDDKVSLAMKTASFLGSFFC